MNRFYLRDKWAHEGLENATSQIIRVNSLFSSQSEDFLITSPLPGKWSAKQCLEHLNLTLEGYIPKLEKAAKKSASSEKNEYRQGIVGAFMIRSMLNSERKVKSRMKTFKSLQPGITGESCIDVVMKFATQMKQLKDCIENLKSKDLHQPRVVSAAGPILRFKPGDAIPFLLLHNERHIIQMDRAVELCKKHK